MRFGQYLKRIREEKDISQKELAEKSGVSAAELSRIETGSRKKVSPNVIKAIYPYLDVSYEVLLSQAGYLDVDSLNDKYLSSQDKEHTKEIDDNTEGILSILASYLFLNKWNVEGSDGFYIKRFISTEQPELFTETAQQYLSDVVARKENEEWHISVKDYQIDKHLISKWAPDHTDTILNVIFKTYGRVATYNNSPITKFSIATNRKDYFNILKKLPPVHLDIKASILLTDLDKNKVIEELVFE